MIYLFYLFLSKISFLLMSLTGSVDILRGTEPSVKTYSDLQFGINSQTDRRNLPLVTTSYKFKNGVFKDLNGNGSKDNGESYVGFTVSELENATDPNQNFPTGRQHVVWFNGSLWPPWNWTMSQWP